MTFLNHEDPSNPPHKCTFLTSTIKEAFANCRNCHRRVPKTEEKEDSSSEMDDEQEVVSETNQPTNQPFIQVQEISFLTTCDFFLGNLTWVLSFFQVVVSEIRSRAMEAKSRRKACLNTESLNFAFSPKVGELLGTQKPVQMNEESELERDEFFSVGSSLSRCSSARSTEAFLSVKTNFSRCSSLSGLERGDFQQFDVHMEFWHGLDFQDLRRRSIIQEVCHCEGWPFGLCRKALLLPPLPKSPSESWSWLEELVKKP